MPPIVASSADEFARTTRACSGPTEAADTRRALPRRTSASTPATGVSTRRADRGRRPQKPFRAAGSWRSATNLLSMPPISCKPRASLDRLARLQDGVVTRYQLREHGYDDDAVRYQVAARRWQCRGQNVVVFLPPPCSSGW